LILWRRFYGADFIAPDFVAKRAVRSREPLAASAPVKVHCSAPLAPTAGCVLTLHVMMPAGNVAGQAAETKVVNAGVAS
jgi:hypothetical protein